VGTIACRNALVSQFPLRYCDFTSRSSRAPVEASRNASCNYAQQDFLPKLQTQILHRAATEAQEISGFVLE